MIWKLRQSLGQYALRKLEKLEFPNLGLNLDQVRSVGVLVNFRDLDSVNFKSVQQELGKMGDVNITFVSFCRHKKDAEKHDKQRGLTVIQASDLEFNLSGKAHIENQFDLIIDYRSEYDLILQLYMLKAKSKLRFGIENTWNKKWLNFMIQAKGNMDLTTVSQQLVHYLKLINTNNDAA